MNATASKSWDMLRQRRRLFFKVCFASIAFALVVVLLAVRLGASIETTMMVLFVAAFPYTLLFYRTFLFECPRCKRSYFLRYLFIDPFVSKCRHCELPLWSEVSEASK